MIVQQQRRVRLQNQQVLRKIPVASSEPKPMEQHVEASDGKKLVFFDFDQTLTVNHVYSVLSGED